MPPLDRIAVFDNDGTLWSEKPFYFQLVFALDRVKALAAQHPEWQEQQPFKAVLEDDIDGLSGRGHESHPRHPRCHPRRQHDRRIRADRPGLDRQRAAPRDRTPLHRDGLPAHAGASRFLRANDFRTYIVSGGGIEFMRAWVEDVYGIPPEQVIGSSIETKFEMRESGPVLVRIPKVDFVDDNEGKPVGIHKFIGRRPILAFGNSDGDHQMLQWTAAGDGARFMGLVHHTDAEREWAYDRDSPVGRLDKALDEAQEKGWTVVDMAARLAGRVSLGERMRGLPVLLRTASPIRLEIDHECASEPKRSADRSGGCGADLLRRSPVSAAGR